MRTNIYIGITLIGVMINLGASAQKILSEGTLVYDVTVQTGAKEPQMADMFDGASTTILLKGSQSRTEMKSALGSTITMIDAKSGSGFVIKEYGNQKLLITMTQADWTDLFKKYNGISFTNTNESKSILGYKCQKAIGKMPDGSTFQVYYTTEISTENKDFDYQFKSLPGLALEYESSVGNLKVKYTASKISFDPVPAQKFDMQKASYRGYREMTYQESIKLKGSK